MATCVARHAQEGDSLILRWLAMIGPCMLPSHLLGETMGSYSIANSHAICLCFEFLG